MNGILSDVKFAFRQLLKNPTFSVVAIVTLALGIMATTAMYSVIYAVVLDPFPYKDVDRLACVKVWGPDQRGFRTYYSTDQFLDIAEQNSIFEGVIASTISNVIWTGAGDPQRLRGNYGTANTFQVMGVPPLLGRTIRPADGAPGASSVVVLGYRFWKNQLGGDPSIVGRELRLNDKVRAVVGVMPKRFMWRGADVYIPITFERGRAIEDIRSVHLLGRVKPGVTPAQAEVDLHRIVEELKKKDPSQFPDNWRVGLLPFKEAFPSSIREALWILFGAVGLLLVIACANVSNLLLSKAGARQKEIAVRSALGATRSRLVRQLLTESLLLAAVGAGLGILLAYGGLQAILAIVPPDTIPDESEIVLNTNVLAFTLLISVVTSVVFGLMPALHACTPNLVNPMREGGRGLAGSTRQALLRKCLVIGEVALSLLLLVGASLMMRTFLAMQDVDLGFRTDRLLTLRVPLPERRYAEPERRVAFFQDLLTRVEAIPGVTAVGLNTSVHPMGNWNAPVELVGSAKEDRRPVLIHQVNSDYTKVFGIGLLEGRSFEPGEVLRKQRLALVNQAFVRARFEGQEPLGKFVRIPRLREQPFGLDGDDSFQIVGVVKDTLNRGVTEQITPEVYLPFTVLGLADRLALLTRGEPEAVIRSVRNEIQAVDKDQPIMDVYTMDTILRDRIYAGPRFNLALFSVFAGVGLTLAVIGVYGVMSHSVAQQKHEIGIRLAIGASPGNIAGMVVKFGMKLLLIGIGLGLVASLLAVRLLSRQIWSVSPFDPISFAGVSVLLLITGLQACLWPARRAARVDPIEALRYE